MSNEKDLKDPPNPSLFNIPAEPDGVPAGAYPATLVRWSGPQMMTGKDFETGEPVQRQVIFAHYMIRLRDGSLSEVSHLLNADGFVKSSGRYSRNSNLYKVLAALNKSWADEGCALAQYVGLPCVVDVVQNAKGYPRVKTISSAATGLNYPKPEEYSAPEGSEDVSF